MSGTGPLPEGMQRQRGTSLLVVMVALLLGSLLVVSSGRVAWLNEKLVSNQSDHQRAFAAAEALLRDAESDIRGERADGTRCSTNREEIGCRGAYADGRPFFPTHQEDPGSLNTDLATVRARIGTGRDCREGICLPTAVEIPQPRAVAATYGQFTGAASGGGNPLLTGSSAKAWYWVEVFQYDVANAPASPAGNRPVPGVSHPFVFRINAYVQGQKPGTQVWLRSVFVFKPEAQVPERPTP